MFLEDPICDAQTKAGTFFFRAEKRVKQLIYNLLGDSWTIIFYADSYTLAPRFHNFFFFGFWDCFFATPLTFSAGCQLARRYR